jgi:hypothetical protein
MNNNPPNGDIMDAWQASDSRAMDEEPATAAAARMLKAIQARTAGQLGPAVTKLKTAAKASNSSAQVDQAL